MMTIYRLQLDKKYVAKVQEATRATDEFGVEPTHDMFGSPEWWQHVRQGTLPVHHVKGRISSVHMGSMNDWPEFTLCTEDGQEFTWSRYANNPEFANLYIVGRQIEVDYVVQRHRATSIGPGTQLRIPIAIRVEENVQRAEEATGKDKAGGRQNG